jgi:hypothetical protein
VVRPTGGGAVVQRSSGSCSLLICCFRCARVGLFRLIKSPYFLSPLSPCAVWSWWYCCSWWCHPRRRPPGRHVMLVQEQHCAGTWRVWRVLLLHSSPSHPSPPMQVDGYGGAVGVGRLGSATMASCDFSENTVRAAQRQVGVGCA